MHRRLIPVAGAVAWSLLIGGVAPAAADGSGDAFNDQDEIGARAGDDQDPGKGGGGSGGTNPCRYEALDEDGIRSAEGLAAGGWAEQPGTGPGTWYRKICDLGNGQTSGTIVWLPNPALDPQALANEAFDRTALPAPDVRLNPPEGEEQVVNLPTWMWIESSQWQPVSASASAGVVTVTATAAPTSVAWDMGNGDVVRCDGPGTPYDSSRPMDEQQSDCTYTYRRSSAGRPAGAFDVHVTVTWTVTWTATGINAGGALGAADRTTTIPVRVAEIQTVNR